MTATIHLDKKEYLKTTIHIIGEPISKHLVDDVEFRSRTFGNEYRFPVKWEEMLEIAKAHPENFRVKETCFGKAIDNY